MPNITTNHVERIWYLCQISRRIHAITCLYYNLRNSVIQRHVFIFVELFRFVVEQIGFEVLVFGPAGPDIEPLSELP